MRARDEKRTKVDVRTHTRDTHPCKVVVVDWRSISFDRHLHSWNKPLSHDVYHLESYYALNEEADSILWLQTYSDERETRVTYVSCIDDQWWYMLLSWTIDINKKIDAANHVNKDIIADAGTCKHRQQNVLYRTFGQWPFDSFWSNGTISRNTQYTIETIITSCYLKKAESGCDWQWSVHIQ